MANTFNKMTVEDIDVKGKRVLLRCDLNVPIKDGKVGDTTRIVESLKTVNYLVEHGAKLIICSHLGKPEKKLDLEPVCKKMEEILKKPIKFLKSDRVIDDNVVAEVNKLKEGEVAMLQNTRVREEESKNEDNFSKELASICDIFVSDAFGTCHRGHCSNYGITKYVPVTVAGYLIKKELDYLCNYIDNPVHPFVTILGGAKIADKLKVIDKALDRSDVVLIGGGMSWTFVKAMGKEIGKSMLDETQIEYCAQMMEKAKKLNKKLVLPVDCVAAKVFPEDVNDKNLEKKVFTIENMDKDYQGLDIGPETIKLFNSYLDTARTVLWNGPMGLFEAEAYAEGTFEVAKKLAELKDCATIIGGGDSAAAVNQFGFADKMTHISTGGGASLEFLKGEPMPGIEAITDKK